MQAACSGNSSLVHATARMALQRRSMGAGITVSPNGHRMAGGRCCVRGRAFERHCGRSAGGKPGRSRAPHARARAALKRPATPGRYP